LTLTTTTSEIMFIQQVLYIYIYMAYVTDMHHGLNVTGIDNRLYVRKIKIQYLGMARSKAYNKETKLFWSSSEVKRVPRKAERDMQEEVIY
jgi:hypothetical protein